MSCKAICFVGLYVGVLCAGLAVESSAAAMPLRGVMLPRRDCTERDFADLHDWGATLVRYQMCRFWDTEGGNENQAEFLAWIDERLDHLQKLVLPQARKYGMKVVVDLHVPPGGRNRGDMKMCYNRVYAERFIAVWRHIATRLKGETGIYGYDLINEPTMYRKGKAAPGCDWWTLQLRAAEAVRAIDPSVTIVFESDDWDSPKTFATMKPFPLTNVVYQAHMYHPHEYTHQGTRKEKYRNIRRGYPDPALGFDKAMLEKWLKPVRDFQLKYGVRIYIGEFSAMCWAEGGAAYLRDCISLFEEYGWDWSYHAFREYEGWSVEHEGVRGSDGSALSFREVGDTDRKRVLLEGLRKGRGDILTAFRTPSEATRPWTYWLWANTCVDAASIRADLADIRRLGFGTVLLSDSRGYWDDADHVVKPKATVAWASDAWLDLVAQAVREAQRQHLQVALNIAASGGHLKGDWDTGADGPKFLYARRYLPGESFETPSLPNYRDVAIFAVRTIEPPVRGDWEFAGDGFFSMEANFGKREGVASTFVPRPALETRELSTADAGAALGAGWTIVRFGAATVKGRETDADVLDDAPVCRHLERVVGRLLPRIEGLAGADRTFAYLYNVSWEGTMPTWSAVFEQDFRRIAGYDLRPLLPILAGFDMSAKTRADLLRDFRHARGEMMKDHLYGAVRRWAHAHGLRAFSESGGPWGSGRRNPATFGECDQLAYLGANDFPQGEFWPLCEKGTDPASGHAVRNGRFFTRGIVSAAHVYGRGIASVEAFTHMHRHWSVDPAFLKPLGDIAFALGVNRFVWHTYTASPQSQGVPGLEFFAGSHINRNVTWNRDLPAFVTYLHRCQELLQRGEPVTDIALLCGDRPYAGWAVPKNRFLTEAASFDAQVTVPKGYASDLVNDAALARDPQLLKKYAVVYDCRPKSVRGSRVAPGKLPPDVETATDWLWCHRRDATADWYFVAGEGRGELICRTAAPQVMELDPVSGRMVRAEAVAQADGRTRVTLDLPMAGSRFIVFSRAGGPLEPLAAAPVERSRTPVAGPWQVAFAYPDGIAAKPPQAVTWSALVDFTQCDNLRHFAGTAVYLTSFTAAVPSSSARVELSLGALPSGLARVFVNGMDCGVVWCAPWRADITAAVKAGANALEIHYVNNWANRLVGDCGEPAAARVTRSALRYWSRPRTGNPKDSWSLRPTVYSGHSVSDPLQPSGILGPVEIVELQKGL